MNVVGTHEFTPLHDYICTQFSRLIDWNTGEREFFSVAQEHLKAENTYRVTLYDNGTASIELIAEKKPVLSIDVPIKRVKPAKRKLKKAS